MSQDGEDHGSHGGVGGEGTRQFICENYGWERWIPVTQDGYSHVCHGCRVDGYLDDFIENGHVSLYCPLRTGEDVGVASRTPASRSAVRQLPSVGWLVCILNCFKLDNRFPICLSNLPISPTSNDAGGSSSGIPCGSIDVPGLPGGSSSIPGGSSGLPRGSSDVDAGSGGSRGSSGLRGGTSDVPGSAFQSDSYAHQDVWITHDVLHSSRWVAYKVFPLLCHGYL
ncbi:hypothetical protein Tco_0915126 [Tanacetum coccineum]